MTELSVKTAKAYAGLLVAPRAPERAPVECATDGATDNRFRALVGELAWRRLPHAVQRRFARHVAAGEARFFRGEVVETRLTWAGRTLARLARLIGGPLPETDRATGPATVLVTENPELGGQVWTRTYTRAGRFPQTINSVKRFSGPTGLEEYLGYGLVMRLRLGVEDGCLVFRSAGYDVELGGWRVAVPRCLTPGTCTITHRDLGGGVFAFTLELVHPRLGRLALQVAHFEEVGAYTVAADAAETERAGLASAAE